MSENQEYPQFLTSAEVVEGFQLLLIRDSGGIDPVGVVVGAKILSSCDLLIKILNYEGQTRYSLRRYIEEDTTNQKAWFPIGGPYDRFDISLDDYERTLHAELFGKINGIPGGFKRISG